MSAVTMNALCTQHMVMLLLESCSITNKNEHENDDIRIVLHLKFVVEHNPQDVAVVHCNDTDVLYILCHHMK
jgi:hypothetical protein